MPRLPSLNGDDTQVVVDRATPSSEYSLRLHPAIPLASARNYRLFSLLFSRLDTAVQTFYISPWWLPKCPMVTGFD